MSDSHYKQAESGQWFSRAWWVGHWDVRNECGEYAEIGGTCNNHHRHEKRLHAQLAREHAEHERRKAQAKHKPAKATRASTRADVAGARHAQVLREESQAMGYKKERAGFYGSAKVAQAEHSESRLTTAQADDEHRKRRAHEREEAEQHREQKKRDTLTRAQKAAAEHAYYRDMKANGW